MTTQDIIREIKKRLRLRMNGDVSAAMRASGMPYKLNFGVDAASLREIGKNYVPDMVLAETLWMESSRECKILATMLYPKAAFDMELAETWLDECSTTELVEQLCFNLLQHQPYANELVGKWTSSRQSSHRSAGYLLLLRLILTRKQTLPLESIVMEAKKDCHADNYQLRLHASRLLERLDAH